MQHFPIKTSINEESLIEPSMNRTVLLSMVLRFQATECREAIGRRTLQLMNDFLRDSYPQIAFQPSASPTFFISSTVPQRTHKI